MQYTQKVFQRLPDEAYVCDVSIPCPYGDDRQVPCSVDGLYGKCGFECWTSHKSSDPNNPAILTPQSVW